MKVDQNYRYDELDGFEPVAIQQRASFRGIWMRVNAHSLLLSSEARKILGEQGFIKAAYNANTLKLLQKAASKEDRYAIRMKKSAISCRMLQELLERECRHDLTITAIRITGTASKSRKNAVIFDLKSAQIEKNGERK